MNRTLFDTARDGDFTLARDVCRALGERLNGEGHLRTLQRMISNMVEPSEGEMDTCINQIRTFTRNTFENKQRDAIDYLFFVAWASDNMLFMIGIYKGHPEPTRIMVNAIYSTTKMMNKPKYVSRLPDNTLRVDEFFPMKRTSAEIFYDDRIGVTQGDLLSYCYNFKGTALEDSLLFQREINRGTFDGMEVRGLIYSSHFGNVVGMAQFAKVIRFPLDDLKPTSIPRFMETFKMASGGAPKENTLLERAWGRFRGYSQN